MRLPIQYLGQAGLKLNFPNLTVYVDPYLSNSAQELDSPDLERMLPIPVPPNEITDADVVLVTHDHLDHCDPQTLPQISKASPRARFIGPKPVIQRLITWGIDVSRLVVAQETWCLLGESNINICAVPAAHPEIERDQNGNLTHIGLIIEYCNYNIYIAGDTCVKEEIIDSIKNKGRIHTAILPVNESNYYRAKRGIIGNMSVREAFLFAADIGAKNVIVTHWDMFKANSTFPEEIRLLYNLLEPEFLLSINPTQINLMDVDVSVIIRTLNEEKHLDGLIDAIKKQKTNGLKTEVIVVDSGSSDRTLEIAKAHGCHIVYISRRDFSFGRSLNIGCSAAAGNILTIVSGHCMPTDRFWIQRLCRPILEGQAQYVYGRQLSGPEGFLSEHRIFAKYFPLTSKIPQEGFFCNNANSAINRDTWLAYLFDERLTGLEDLELAQRLVNSGGKVAYVAEASVYHYHAETWVKIRRRFEREAIALQKIMPQLQVSLWDSMRYFLTSCYKDMTATLGGLCTKRDLKSIVLYRWNQYIGTWRGNNEHRKLSLKQKEKYFYP